jgi:hypothetical protein
MFEKRLEFDWKLTALVIGIIVLLGFAFYLMFDSKECYDLGCFQNSMINCRLATYINEEPEASWKYDIRGDEDDLCEIEVTLLAAKHGSLKLKKYEGHSMGCFYGLGVWTYPEKELVNCHGRLKEDLQEIIINNLHSYVVDNIGEINEELGQI